MARRKILKNADYAQICLNCPFPECIQDWWGECDRTRPYTIETKARFISEETTPKREKEKIYE